MALNLFDKWKKRKEPTRRDDAEVQVAQDVETAAPSIPAPTSLVIKSFHISEKASRLMGFNQYTFLVDMRATKSQVRDAIQRSYQVHVTNVQMVTLPAKKRTFGRRRGMISAKKKAIVSLKTGEAIAAAQP